ncbi:SMP-30/gluconolactonase/LRE family protein [Neptunicella sp.]|uniref:SMP-30/gluconolactonase/LRE family protein n=1 Tax=Neptunicella sp. TaxID=2125986 RepID=UPI003F68DEDD
MSDCQLIPLNQFDYQCWGPHCTLGEGVYWHPEHHRVYWVDIKQHNLHWLCLTSRQVRSLTLDESICWVAATIGKPLIVGLTNAIYLLDPDNGERQFYCAPSNEPAFNRLNDAKVDELGRLWFGTMDDQEQRASGHLYQLGTPPTPIRQDSGYVVSNGPTFCPLTKRLFHTDSVNRTIYQFDLGAAGQLHNKRVFTRFGDAMGFPDGMTVDAQGGVWVAQWDGGGVCRFNQQGQLDLQIALPSQRVTNVVFGGENLTSLFITTATNPLEVDVVQPHAGQLFELDVRSLGFSGLTPVPYKR